MLVDVKVPQFAEGATKIKLNSWRISVGDTVAEGDEIAEATTDKIAVSIETQSAGVVEEILVDAGEFVAVGQVIARIQV